MTIIRRADLEKWQNEVRAVVAGLEELELSEDNKLGRNLLSIWGAEIIKACALAVRGIDGGMTIGDRFRYRGILKRTLPSLKNRIEDFFIQAESFTEGLR